MMGRDGHVLRIERTSSYDGDGLRTVVFMKGCPMHCLWCSTPESQSFSPEIGCDQRKCQKCHICINECPISALTLGQEKFPFCQPGMCNGCGICIKKCPHNAIVKYGMMMTPEEVVHEISKDEIFYFHSGGGFTLSGGEALSQPEFAAEVLRLSLERGIRGTAETSCCVPWRNFEQVLPYMNEIYTDIKHMDTIEHERLTGQRNELILENIRKIGERGGTKIIVRLPLIPGINDSDENMKATAEFCCGLKNLREIELLAYHRLGAETYRKLGRPVPLPYVEPPTFEKLLRKAKVISLVVKNLPVKINGVRVA